MKLFLEFPHRIIFRWGDFAFGRTNWKTEYNITDHLGSVKLSVNTDGSVVNSKTYSDFGKASNSAPSDRLGYIGKENDVESGLGDFGVRKYDTEGGRCIIIAEIQDFNC